MAVPTTAARGVPASASLYPPARNRAIEDMLMDMAPFDGSVVDLRRGLATAEVATLKARQAALLPWMQGAAANDIKRVLMRCFVGFNYAPNPQEAEAVVVQFIMVLIGKPLWAIERAAMKFANGEVRPEEVGAKRLDLRDKPTTSQMRVVVDGLIESVAYELHRLDLTLRATPPRKQESESDRARGIAIIQEWSDRVGIHKREDDKIESRRAAEEIDKLHRARVLREYAEHGLEPPTESEGKMLVSLSLLQAMGWTIQQDEHHLNVLVAPPAREPRRWHPGDDGR